MPELDSYAKDGVNLTAGNAISAFAAKLNRTTWLTAPGVDIEDFAEGNFRGLVEFWPNLPIGSKLTAGCDGTGTKSIFRGVSRLWQHAGRDLLAMGNGDLTRRGALPLCFLNVLDTATLGEIGSETFIFFQNLLTSLRDAAVEEEVALLGGETAELGVGVGSDDPDAIAKFNWAGFAIGASHPRVRILGSGLRAGQIVVAFRDRSFRCNWFSGVRSAFKLRFGPEYYRHPDAQDALQQAATPAALYDKFLAKANGWGSPKFQDRIPLVAIAHITGGGIKEKFAEDVMSKTGLSADLSDLWDPPEIMRQCVEWRKLDGTYFPDEQVYGNCHGGQGVLVVLEETHVADFLALAKQEGKEAKVCGQIFENEDDQVVQIHSKFGGGLVSYWL